MNPSVLLYVLVIFTSLTYAEISNNLQAASTQVNTDNPIQIHITPTIDSLKGASARRSPRTRLFDNLFGKDGKSNKIDYLLKQARTGRRRSRSNSGRYSNRRYNDYDSDDGYGNGGNNGYNDYDSDDGYGYDNNNGYGTSGDGDYGTSVRYGVGSGYGNNNNNGYGNSGRKSSRRNVGTY